MFSGAEYTRWLKPVSTLAGPLYTVVIMMSPRRSLVNSMVLHTEPIECLTIDPRMRFPRRIYKIGKVV